ncbi:hypothetical protein [Singulisphaera acidiphila]|uniref:Uncharacterized protein n=1 Tax=Singulisphaera acidiphila (strain ATCC BAA-1392 / DSM 18658 / VKM B-2454 / MOB10) TaxID=886293 RepID=L0D7P1_SINAD|nr:hypothetical protein [Singulisphaera acidiphila]AGA25272.1 hypothetical protein Sinac_0865 [Singulisphaera acidiphila DSM 18658]
MRHPFDGLNTPCNEDLATSATRTDRRSVLTWIFTAAAGVVTTLLGRTASAQSNIDQRRRQPTTFALGEEGGIPQSPPRRYPFSTTRRWGEAGRVTTFAFGEEGGVTTTYATGEEGGATTYAFGEEGGVTTTYAAGEEGGATTYAVGEEGGVTTYAAGEEGGATTYAVGEEGGVTSFPPLRKAGS